MNYKTELLEEKFKNILSNKNYSVKTIDNYMYHVRCFHQSSNKRIQDLNLDDLKTLRHSCFTNLLENGTDIMIIKDIAGHSNIKTTEIYTCFK